MTRIAIVGGGPGGLFTAKLLEQFCADLCEVTIFEAGPRLGGKVLTEQFTKVPVPYEAGVAEIYDYSHFGPDPIRRMIKKFGLSTVRMRGPAVILGNAVLRNAKDIRRNFGERTQNAIEDFHRKCHEMCSPEEYYEGHWQDDNQNPWSGKTFREVLDEIPDETARRYIEVAVRSDVASEPHLTSALNGLKNVLMDDPRYLRLYSIEGGIQRLTDALAQRLESTVHLNSPAAAVGKYDDGTYRLTTRRDGKFEDHRFDMVILALPNYWLERLDFDGRDLRQAMQKHLAHYDRPAHYLRISVLFKQPFWREQVPGAYFMTDAFGGCCVYDEGARHACAPYGVLGWLLAGNDAMSLNNLSDDDLIRKALDSLPDSLAHGRELFVEGRVHRWIGTINALPGGNPVHDIRARHVPEPKRHPGLFVVGDYLFDSTINGAYDSAEYVNDMILSKLRRKKYLEFQSADMTVSNGKPHGNGKTSNGNGQLTNGNGKPAAAHHDDGQLDKNYHDHYNGEVSYEDSFEDCFNLEWTLKIIETIWGRSPPYRLLDCGSANGLTLPVFASAGIDAWGIENSEYIHSRTPAKWKKRNILGDVRKLPFPDNSFDFVYDTALCYVPPEDIDKAISELFRVCRVGIFFGGVTADMTKEVIEDYSLFKGVRSVYTLSEWAEIFMRNGFRPAVHSPKILSKVWQIESEVEVDDWYWYHSADSMRYCFYSKPAPVGVKVKKNPVKVLTAKE